MAGPLNSYPAVDQAAADAVAAFGTSTHGVRLLAGTLDLHHQLERRLATFKRSEASVVFSSGYVTNIAVISTLVPSGGVIICDKLDHASIVDGCLLSRATLMRFRHNDVDDLERCLEQSAGRPMLVIVDAVYSMDGDVASLPEISELCRQHGAALMVDEAHSLGVLGASGRGIDEHYDLGDDVIDIKMGTLSKTIPAAGGYVAGSQRLVDALKHNARPYIFSAALAPPLAAAALASLDVIEGEPWRVARLSAVTQRAHSRLRAAGFDLLNSSTPIIPVTAADEKTVFEMTRRCRARGVYVTPVVYPAVPAVTPRLRVVVTAALGDDELDEALDVIVESGMAATAAGS